MDITRKRIDNDANIYYIIHRDDPNVGIFSCILTFLSHLRYAESMGYIPVIDMMNYNNEYIYNVDVGKNAWEFYFEQPVNISLIEAYSKKNIILSSGHFMEEYEPSTQFLNCEFAHDSKIWRNLWKKYIHINTETRNYIEIQWGNIQSSIDEGDKILGVLFRGTDYYFFLDEKIIEVEKTIYRAIMLTKHYMKIYHCKWIFLVTEDVDVFNMFKNEFNNLLLFLDDIRISMRKENKELLGVQWKKNDIDLKKKGLNYITNIFILSKCDYFIGNKTSASVFIPIISDIPCSFWELHLLEHDNEFENNLNKYEEKNGEK